MKVCLTILCCLFIIAGCAGSGKRETVAGHEIQRTVEEACVQVANDMKIPTGQKVVVGPIVAYDNRVNREVKAGLSDKFGVALQSELSRRGVAVIERKHLDTILAEQKMTMSAMFAERHRIGGLLKADYIIVGSVAAEARNDKYITIVLKCDNVEQGRAVVSSTVNIEYGPISGITINDIAVENVRCSDAACRICGGAGSYNCPECNGSGYLEAPRMCTACNGQGFSPCMQCMQTGKCQMCQGTGYVAGVVCTACSGGGGCPSGCEGGRLKCSVCQGKGQVAKLCRNRDCKNGKILHTIPKE